MNEHPLAAIFPVMEDDQRTAMLADIKANGIRVPIVVYEGMILDGRQRYKLAQEAGVPCPQRSFEGGDPLAFIMSANMYRRHLSTAQRAAVAAEVANMRRTDTLKQNLTDPPKDGSVPVSIGQAAKLMNVSVRSVERAIALKRTDPEAHERVKRGEKPPPRLSIVTKESRSAPAVVAVARPTPLRERYAEFADAVEAACVPGGETLRTLNRLAKLGHSFRFFQFLHAKLLAAEARTPLGEGDEISAHTLVPGLHESFKAYMVLFDRHHDFKEVLAEALFKEWPALVAAARARHDLDQYRRSKAPPPPPPRNVTVLGALMERFGDGVMRTSKEMAAELEVNEKHVKAVLDEWHDECFIERFGDGKHYRLYPAAARRLELELRELRHELSSTLQDICSEAHKHDWSRSPAAIVKSVRKIEKILNDLAK